MATLNTSPLASGEMSGHASNPRQRLLWYACYIAPPIYRHRCLRTRPQSNIPQSNIPQSNLPCNYICITIEDLTSHDQEDHGSEPMCLEGSPTSSVGPTASDCSFGLLWFVCYVTTSPERYELVCKKTNALLDLPCNYVATTIDQLSDHDRRDHHYYWCGLCSRYVTIGEAGHHIQRHSKDQEAGCECYVCGDWLDPDNLSANQHLHTPHTTPVAGSNLSTVVVDSPVLNRSAHQTCSMQSQVSQRHGPPARRESSSTCSTPPVGLGFEISGLEAFSGKCGLE